MAAIAKMNHDAYDYVHPCFSKEKFLATYAHSIQPMGGSVSWPKTSYTKILPPLSRRLPGRPKTKRKKGKFEQEDAKRHKVDRSGGTQRCSYCQGYGHKKKNVP